MEQNFLTANRTFQNYYIIAKDGGRKGKPKSKNKGPVKSIAIFRQWATKQLSK